MRKSSSPSVIPSHYDYRNTMSPSSTNAANYYDNQYTSLFGDPVPPPSEEFLESFDSHLYGSMRRNSSLRSFEPDDSFPKMTSFTHPIERIPSPNITVLADNVRQDTERLRPPTRSFSGGSLLGDGNRPPEIRVYSGSASSGVRILPQSADLSRRVVPSSPHIGMNNTTGPEGYHQWTPVQQRFSDFSDEYPETAENLRNQTEIDVRPKRIFSKEPVRYPRQESNDSYSSSEWFKPTNNYQEWTKIPRLRPSSKNVMLINQRQIQQESPLATLIPDSNTSSSGEEKSPPKVGKSLDSRLPSRLPSAKFLPAGSTVVDAKLGAENIPLGLPPSGAILKPLPAPILTNAINTGSDYRINPPRPHKKSSFTIIAERSPQNSRPESPSPKKGRSSPFLGRGFKDPSRPSSPSPRINLPAIANNAQISDELARPSVQFNMSSTPGRITPSTTKGILQNRNRIRSYEALPKISQQPLPSEQRLNQSSLDLFGGIQSAGGGRRTSFNPNPTSRQRGLLRIINSADSSPSRIPVRANMISSMDDLRLKRRQSLSPIRKDRRRSSISPERRSSSQTEPRSSITSDRRSSNLSTATSDYSFRRPSAISPLPLAMGRRKSILPSDSSSSKTGGPKSFNRRVAKPTSLSPIIGTPNKEVPPNSDDMENGARLGRRDSFSKIPMRGASRSGSKSNSRANSRGPSLVNSRSNSPSKDLLYPHSRPNSRATSRSTSRAGSRPDSRAGSKTASRSNSRVRQSESSPRKSRTLSPPKRRVSVPKSRSTSPSKTRRKSVSPAPKSISRSTTRASRSKTDISMMNTKPTPKPRSSSVTAPKKPASKPSTSRPAATRKPAPSSRSTVRKEPPSAKKTPSSSLKKPESSVKRTPSTTRKESNLKKETSNIKRTPSNLKKGTSNFRREGSTVKKEANALKREPSSIKKGLIKRQPSSTKIDSASKLKREPSNLMNKRSDSNLSRKLEKKNSFKNEKKPNPEATESTAETAPASEAENQEEVTVDANGRLIPMTKANVVSMTTAAITAQPVQITTTLTNHIPLSKSNSQSQINTGASTSGSLSDLKADDMLPTAILEKSTRTLETIQKTVTEATDEIQKTINENLTDLKTLESDMGKMADDIAQGTAAPLEKSENLKTIMEQPGKEGGSPSHSRMTTQSTTTNADAGNSSSGKSPAPPSQPIEAEVSILNPKKSSDNLLQPNPTGGDGKSNNNNNNNNSNHNNNNKSGNGGSGSADPTGDRGDMAERVSERAISVLPEVECESANLQSYEPGEGEPNDGKPIEGNIGGYKKMTTGNIIQAANEGNGNNNDDKKGTGSQEFLGEDPPPGCCERSRCGRLCSRLCMPCRRLKGLCSCCKKCKCCKGKENGPDSTPTAILKNENEKLSCWKRLKCCKRKKNLSSEEMMQKKRMEPIKEEPEGHGSNGPKQNKCRLCLNKFLCCRATNKVETTSGDEDEVKKCCFCIPCRRKKKDNRAWQERRESIVSNPPPGGKCSRLMDKLKCWKKKKPDSESRRTSMNSKKQSIAPTLPPEDTRPKLHVDLVEFNSKMKGAIPVMPLYLAWFCMLCNVLIPGLGTILSGLFCLCVGIPRFSQYDSAKARIGSFVINCIVGVSQLFCVLFCLVGWGWSMWWGTIMLKTARKLKKIKHVEQLELQEEQRQAALRAAADNKDVEAAK